jgi:Tfp pilus assembly protein PilV
MKSLRTNNKTGFTLVEVMVAMVIIIIGIVGAMGFRYFCVLDAKKADAQITAARIATLLLEDWKGAGGLAYVPNTNLSSSSGLTVAASSTGPAAAFPNSILNNTSYHVVCNVNASSIIHYYVTLSSAATLPRTLNVSVGWRNDYKADTLSTTDKTNRVISITTYCD